MLLQDWTTVSGNGGVITQSRRGWADLPGVAGLTFWLEVRDASSDLGAGLVTLLYESAPADEDVLFKPVGSVALAITTSAIVTRVQLGGDPANALGRFLRWSIQGAGRWTATFRVMVMESQGLQGAPGLSGDTSGFRLTLTSGVPVTTSGAAGVAAYFTPFRHNQILLFDGSHWRSFIAPELSITPPAIASKVYDIFAFYDTATMSPQLDISSAWTNDTMRADAVARKDGIFVKSSDPTRRLVGTVRTNVSGILEDTVARRYVWNADNRVDRTLLRTETADTWSYAGAAWRASNNNTANAIGYVDGAGEEIVSATAVGRARSVNAFAQVGYTGIGLDASTSVAAQVRGSDAAVSTTAATPCRAFYNGFPGIGAHLLYWTERAGGTDACIFAGAPGSEIQYGIFGTVKA